MRALSLTRPWPWLVLHGGKGGRSFAAGTDWAKVPPPMLGVENRSQPTSYRGPLVIHGALSADRDAIVPFLDLIRPDAQEAFDLAVDDGSLMHTGLLGVVDLVGCCTNWRDGGLHHCTCSGWAMPGQCHWQLANPRPFRTAIPAKGALGLWRLTPDQQREVDLRLANAQVHAR
jgi:hypothetical protein